MDGQTFWCKDAPGKANILLWRASFKRLPTRANLLIRGVNINSGLCPFCGISEESESHIFCLCDYAVDVLRALHGWYPDFIYNSSTIGDFAKTIGGLRRPVDSLKEIIHLAYLWKMWEYRNEIVHGGASKDYRKIVAGIKVLAFGWYRSRVKNSSCLNWDLWCLNPSHACNSLHSN